MRSITYTFLVRCHIVITQRAVNIDDPIGGTLGQNGMNPALRILDIFLHKGDTQNLFLLVGTSTGSGRHTRMEKRVELLKDGSFGST